ncbi:MAG: hypothetical protein LBS90_07145 [Oscillospiraceae bacterium]|nr:hypothetical protein [Oscillospiraceae bacterium]
MNVEKTALTRAYASGGFPVAELAAEYPRASGGGKAAARINRYYEHLARRLESAAERKLAPLASADLTEKIARGRTFRGYILRQTCEITECGDGKTAVSRTLGVRKDGGWKSKDFAEVWGKDGFLC